jgi:hypothetical protein
MSSNSSALGLLLASLTGLAFWRLRARTAGAGTPAPAEPDPLA